MGSVSMNPVFRSEVPFGYYYYNNNYTEQNNTMLEKRQVFLRSYQFCRKKSFTERIKGSLVRAKKIVWLRLRSACKLRRSLKCAFYYRRRRFFQLLHNNNNRITESSSCLCSSRCLVVFAPAKLQELRVMVGDPFFVKEKKLGMGV
ncbi:hypothetical protein HKD37_10G028712 [Glycine soja]